METKNFEITDNQKTNELKNETKNEKIEIKHIMNHSRKKDMFDSINEARDLYGGNYDVEVYNHRHAISLGAHSFYNKEIDCYELMKLVTKFPPYIHYCKELKDFVFTYHLSEKDYELLVLVVERNFEKCKVSVF